MGEPQSAPSDIPKGHLTMNLEIKHEMGSFSLLGVKDRRECKRHQKLGVSAEMLKTSSGLPSISKPGEMREREQDVLGIGH